MATSTGSAYRSPQGDRCDRNLLPSASGAEGHWFESSIARLADRSAVRGDPPIAQRCGAVRQALSGGRGDWLLELGRLKAPWRLR